MAKRKRADSFRMKKDFRRTAHMSKKINVDPKIYRGGIRL